MRQHRPHQQIASCDHRRGQRDPSQIRQQQHRAGLYRRGQGQECRRNIQGPFRRGQRRTAHRRADSRGERVLQ